MTAARAAGGGADIDAGAGSIYLSGSLYETALSLFARLCLCFVSRVERYRIVLWELVAPDDGPVVSALALI